MQHLYFINVVASRDCCLLVIRSLIDKATLRGQFLMWTKYHVSALNQSLDELNNQTPLSN